MDLRNIPHLLTKRVLGFINEKRGWTTDKKIIVIESDDWGSIRMPSKLVYQKLLNFGLPVNDSIYNKFDSLERKDDMELLFEVLYKHKDINSNPAVITANSIIANPDFEKIKNDKFNNYYFELFTDTIKRKNVNTIETWFDGIRNKVFYPQYHGREHVNVNRWMRYLRKESKILRIAFDYEMFGVSKILIDGTYPNFLAALAVDDDLDYKTHENALKEGYIYFEKIFGYKSLSFIAPNYIWHPCHESVLNDIGVRFLQGSDYQKIPQPNQLMRDKSHYIGQVSNYQQYYLVRNCFFEPSSNPNKDWVYYCLKGIDHAFSNKKPAIICSHRVNFIGSIVVENRDKNLILLENLLRIITKKWPDVEFMTSDQLGNLIETSEQKHLTIEY